MNKAMKTIMAFAAVFLCGGVWADVDETGITPKYWNKFDSWSNSSPYHPASGSLPLTPSDERGGSTNLSAAGLKGGALTTASGSVHPNGTNLSLDSGDWTIVSSLKIPTDNHTKYAPLVIIGDTFEKQRGLGLFSTKSDTEQQVHLIGWGSNFSAPAGTILKSVTVSDASTAFHSYAIAYNQANSSLTLYVNGVAEEAVTISASETYSAINRFQWGGVPGGVNRGNPTKLPESDYARISNVVLDDFRIYVGDDVPSADKLSKIAATAYLAESAKADYSASFDVVSSETARSLTASSKLGGTAITPNTSGQRGDWKNEAPTLVASGYDGVNKALKIKNGQTPYQEGSIVGNGDFSLLAVAKMTPATINPKVIVSVGDASWGNNKGITLAYFNKAIHVIAWNKSATGSPNFPAAISVADIPWVESTYHAYLLTYNNTSKVVNLFVDGELKGTKTIDFAPGRTGYQIGGIFGGASEIKLSVGEDNKACAMGYDICIDEVGIWKKDATQFAQAACLVNPVWPMANDDLQWKPTVTGQTELSYTGNQLQDASGADANIVENGRIFFNSNAEVVIPDAATVGELIANSGTLKVRKGSSSGVFGGERIVVNPGATLDIDYVDDNAPVFPVDTETTIVLNGGSVDSSGWPTVEGAVNFETLVDTTIWNATVCSTGKIIKSGDATLTLGAWLTNRSEENYIPHDVQVTAGQLVLKEADNVVNDLTIASGASISIAGTTGSLTIKGKLTVNSAESFTIPSNFTLDTAATVSIASGTLKSTRNDLAIVDVPEDKIVVLSDADGEGYYTYSIDVPVASITVGDTTTKYASVAAASAAALAAGATAESPQTVTLLCNSIAAIEIPGYVTINPAAYKFMGAITGTGTIELACTDNSTTAEIGSWFASNTLTDFTGCVKIAGGRIKATAALESGVKIKVVNGGQLWILGGTWSNTFEVSGNGWEGEKSNNDISYAAIRVDGINAATAITISGSITASVENGIVPTIGVHSSTAATISGSISCANGVRLISESATGVLTITGAINGGEGEPSPVVEKIGSGKVVFGSTATATNLALKLSAGKIEKTSSTTFTAATTDAEDKLVFSSSTGYKLITGTLMENTDTKLWGSDNNSSYLSRSADAPTAVFASNVSLAQIANGEYKFTGKMKGVWIDVARAVTVVNRTEYVAGSNVLELQCQMFDGRDGYAISQDWYTKAQNITLYQIEKDGVYYIFAQGYKGFYVNDHDDHRGDIITLSTPNYHTVDGENAYEAIKLELVVGDVVAKIGDTSYKTLAGAIEAANAMQGDAEIVMQGSAESPLESTDSVTLNSNVILKMTPYAKTIGTISGSGVVVFDGFLPGNAQRNVFVTDAWTGTVVIEHVTANTTYGNFGTCCNANSSLALDGVSCYFYTNGTAANPDVVCKNLTIGDDGIKLQGRFSTGITKYTFKKLQGSGTITVEADNDGGANKHGYLCLIGDVSEFDGKIAFGTGNNKHEVVIAADADDLPPLDAANYTAGTIYYASGAARPDIIADGTTLTVAPGGDLTVPADFNVADVTVKYAGTVLNNESGPIAVAIVDNKLVYSIKPEKEDTVRPTVTTMAAPTIESQDRISFTISSPIPGLFYSVVSARGPTDSDFESGTDSIGTQATGSDSHTTSIDMPTDAKVKYFRVRVKATK